MADDATTPASAPFDDEAMAGLIEGFEAALRRERERDAGPSPQAHIRASGLDWCARAMFYDVARWQERPAFAPEVVARLQRGRDIERALTVRLLDAGLPIEESQRHVELRDEDGRVLLTGHIDGVIRWRGVKVIYEVKSVHPNLWGRLRTVDDLLHDAYCWRWVLQMLAYLHAYGRRAGLFILDDCLGHQRFLPLWRDRLEGVWRRLLEALRVAVRAIERGTPPPQHGDPAHCQRCRWREAAVCMPALAADAGETLRLLASEELERALLEREELEPQYRAYQAASRVIDAATKPLSPGRYLCGPFQIRLSEHERAGYWVRAAKIKRKTIERIVGAAAHEVRTGPWQATA